MTSTNRTSTNTSSKTLSETTHCKLDGIRVWRGFRSRAFLSNRTGFEEKIGSIFVPQTAQQMEPLGLAAYFPALLPDSRAISNDVNLKIPDEIALVVYPSNEIYKRATGESVAGRAYGLLHSTVFNFDTESEPHIPKSTSDFPEQWHNNWQENKSYYLTDEEIDWRSGATWTLAAKPREDILSPPFRDAINSSIDDWQSSSHANINGAIICICSEYLLYWEHNTADDDTQSLVPKLLSLLEQPFISKKADLTKVPPAFTTHDYGVKMTEGDVFDVRVTELLR